MVGWDGEREEKEKRLYPIEDRIDPTSLNFQEIICVKFVVLFSFTFPVAIGRSDHPPRIGVNLAFAHDQERYYIDQWDVVPLHDHYPKRLVSHLPYGTRLGQGPSSYHVHFSFLISSSLVGVKDPFADFPQVGLVYGLLRVLHFRGFYLFSPSSPATLFFTLYGLEVVVPSFLSPQPRLVIGGARSHSRPFFLSTFLSARV
jgi:hypothetical protein